MKICCQRPGLDTGLAANLEKMPPFSDHADRQLLAARPYSLRDGSQSTYVGDYYKIQSYRPLRLGEG